KLPLAGQKPLSQEPFGPGQPPPFYKIAMVRHQDVPDQIGVAERKEILPSDFKPDDVAVLFLRRHQKRDRIAPESKEVPQYRHPLRPRRINIFLPSRLRFITLCCFQKLSPSSRENPCFSSVSFYSNRSRFANHSPRNTASGFSPRIR